MDRLLIAPVQKSTCKKPPVQKRTCKKTTLLKKPTSKKNAPYKKCPNEKRTNKKRTDKKMHLYKLTYNTIDDSIKHNISSLLLVKKYLKIKKINKKIFWSFLNNYFSPPFSLYYANIFYPFTWPWLIRGFFNLKKYESLVLSMPLETSLMLSLSLFR